jgi:hypothetical protein
MTTRNERIYIRAPVDVGALDQLIERSVAPIVRSHAILKRLAAANETYAQR